MESFGGLGFVGSNKSVRKRRSNLYRRPLNDSQQFPNCYADSSISSTPPYENVSKASSDDNGDNVYCHGKELNVNQCCSRASYTNIVESETALTFSNDDRALLREPNELRIRGGGDSKDGGICSEKFDEEGSFAPADWETTSKGKDGFLLSSAGDTQVSGSMSETYIFQLKGVPSDGQGNECKLRKVELKVGEVMHTIHTMSTSGGASIGGSSSTRSSHSLDAPHPRHNLILDSADDYLSPSQDKGPGLQGVPWKDFSRTGCSIGMWNSSRGEILEASGFIRHSDKYEAVRKSKRVPKKLFFDDEDGDDEIQYLEKLKSSKTDSYFLENEDEDGGGKKKQKISKVLSRTSGSVYDVHVGDYGASRSGKRVKRSKSGRASQDTDYVDEESMSDRDLEIKKKKQISGFVDVLGNSTRKMSVTTRRRALHTGKDISSISRETLIEFPNGLPPAPPRKQKEKLSEVEQQLKKTEAALRRRMQMEKAARESEAEAIRKILSQDSSRKKRGEKIKKWREELAQERSANSMLTANTVRWVMGPTGSVVTFPNEIGLPSIFETKPCSYPLPREKCAGPSCTNPYKYRVSKSKLPICSLLCYKKINDKMQPLTAC